jgi:hypothetical protein
VRARRREAGWREARRHRGGEQDVVLVGLVALAWRALLVIGHGGSSLIAYAIKTA